MEFPSYEDAMANLQLAETSEVVAWLAGLCDEAPTFRSLDLTRDMPM